MTLGQIKLVWVRVRVEGECFWVNLREENKVSESNMVEFYHHQVESEWMSEGFFCANGGHQSWEVWVSLRGKTKMFGCPHIFGWCLDAPCTYTTQRKDTLSDKGGVHMPPYICMPPVNKQHKESMLCQTKGVSICHHRFRCHHMLGYHLCVGMPPLCLDAAIWLEAPPVCLNTPICLDTPVCLDVPICLDIFIYLDAHLYVWTYPICLNSPYVWMPLYVWVPPIFGHPSVWLDIPTFGHPLYV